MFKNALLGLLGSKINFTAEQILSLLSNYKNIDDNKLRENLICFLSEIAPLAEELNLKLAIHPDSPPFSVMGLPRAVCTADDIKKYLKLHP